MKSTFYILALLGAQLAVAQESAKTIVTEMLKHKIAEKAQKELEEERENRNYLNNINNNINLYENEINAINNKNEKKTL